MGTMSSATSARLALVGAALLWSGNSAFIKASTLGGWQVAGLRSGVAALVFLMLLPGARRVPEARSFRVGLAYAGTMVSFAVANRLTTGASAVFLQATAPFWVIVLAPRMLGERASRGDLVSVGLVGGAMSLFFVGSDAPSATAPAPLAGNAFALASGVFWALTVIGFRGLGNDPRASERTVPGALLVGNALACAIGLVAGWPLPTPAPHDVAIVLWLGAFAIALAYVWFARGVRDVPALEASLVCLLEPAFNPVWTWLAHDERPRVATLWGGALILATTAVKSWRDARPASA